jgi:hypothetical protein
MVAPRPAFVPTGGAPVHIGAEDTFDADYGRLLERVQTARNGVRPQREAPTCFGSSGRRSRPRSPAYVVPNGRFTRETTECILRARSRHRRTARIVASKMRNKKWDPSCSFCGSREEPLVRAGGRDYWICARCIENPSVEDSREDGSRCTFCEEPVNEARPGAAARRGVLLCREYLQVCNHLLTQSRRARAIPLTSPQF